MESEADCGSKCTESSMRFGQDIASLKTLQCWPVADSTGSFGILPRFGLMLDGEYFRQPMLEHATSVRGYGLQESIGTPIRSASCRGEKFIAGGQLLNPYEICKRDGGRPKIEWIEHLMGWPTGWTDLEPLEMDKYQQWLSAHGKNW